MRLIDADAFEAELNERLLPMLIERYGRDEAIKGLHFSFRDVVCNIKGQPTIEPERKKGRWIPQEDEDGEPYGDKCSECGARYVMPEGKTNYCPKCGARMEGER